MRRDRLPFAIVNIISNIPVFGKQNIAFFICCYSNEFFFRGA